MGEILLFGEADIMLVRRARDPKAPVTVFTFGGCILHDPHPTREPRITPENLCAPSRFDNFCPPGIKKSPARVVMLVDLI